MPPEFQVFAYVFGGAVHAGPEGREVRDGQAALFGPGDEVALAVPADAKAPARLLLLGGVPLREPVARYGPFVMNSAEEIHQAIVDFQAGRLGAIDR